MEGGTVVVRPRALDANTAIEAVEVGDRVRFVAERRRGVSRPREVQKEQHS